MLAQDSEVRLPRTHEVLRRRHTSDVGVKFVLLMIVIRIAGSMTGCGPADGQLGGKCLESGGCSNDGRCNEGQCVTNGTCEEDDPDLTPQAPRPHPATTCNLGPPNDCPSRTIAFVCEPTQLFPIPVGACDLNLAGSEDAGGVEYCCDPAIRVEDGGSSFFDPFIDP